ncbi:ABC transporter permease [Halobellus marinus]|uniref:ABC transporter permease n=1 Tax=Halobellus TaxID=1073986 RepID=UPI0028AB6749|nr:ABC transporter permease [Halobellus sp. DFY28]
MANNVTNYVAWRLARFVFLLFALITIIFFLFRVMPGDPTALLLTGNFSEEARQAMLENFGLDKPLHEQYFIFIVNIFQGEFGRSYFYKEPVLDVIIPRMVNTLLIMIPALSLVMINAYITGSYLGWNKGTLRERIGTYLPLSLRAMPHFVLGLFLLMIFSYWLNWFPIGGMGPIGGRELNLIETITSPTFYKYAALPFATALFHYIGDPLLLMRSNIISERNKDYIELLELKGLSPRKVREHAARNSLLPLLTWLTPMVGVAFGGQILIEVVFSWPGIGRALVLAAQRQDFPIAQAAFFIIAFLVLLTNLIVDLAYGYFDPRITYGES